MNDPAQNLYKEKNKNFKLKDINPCIKWATYIIIPFPFFYFLLIGLIIKTIEISINFSIIENSDTPFNKIIIILILSPGIIIPLISIYLAKKGLKINKKKKIIADRLPAKIAIGLSIGTLTIFSIAILSIISTIIIS